MDPKTPDTTDDIIRVLVESDIAHPCPFCGAITSLSSVSCVKCGSSFHATNDYSRTARIVFLSILVSGSILLLYLMIYTTYLRPIQFIATTNTEIPSDADISNSICLIFVGAISFVVGMVGTILTGGAITVTRNVSLAVFLKKRAKIDEKKRKLNDMLRALDEDE